MPPVVQSLNPVLGARPVFYKTVANVWFAQTHLLFLKGCLILDYMNLAGEVNVGFFSLQ